jgi:hypothetical protein
VNISCFFALLSLVHARVPGTHLFGSASDACGHRPCSPRPAASAPPLLDPSLISSPNSGTKAGINNSPRPRPSTRRPRRWQAPPISRAGLVYISPTFRVASNSPPLAAANPVRRAVARRGLPSGHGTESDLSRTPSMRAIRRLLPASMPAREHPTTLHVGRRGWCGYVCVLRR